MVIYVYVCGRVMNWSLVFVMVEDYCYIILFIMEIVLFDEFKGF